jgi:hypothetical protein
VSYVCPLEVHFSHLSRAPSSLCVMLSGCLKTWTVGNSLSPTPRIINTCLVGKHQMKHLYQASRSRHQRQEQFFLLATGSHEGRLQSEKSYEITRVTNRLFLRHDLRRNSRLLVMRQPQSFMFCEIERSNLIGAVKSTNRPSHFPLPHHSPSRSSHPRPSALSRLFASMKSGLAIM